MKDLLDPDPANVRDFSDEHLKQVNLRKLIDALPEGALARHQYMVLLRGTWELAWRACRAEQTSRDDLQKVLAEGVDLV